MSEDELTSAEEEELKELLGVGYPKKEEKSGIFNFFNKILRTGDSTKVANLEGEELNSVRELQSAALYADQMGLNTIKDHLRKEGEIILATSDSKEGFLIKSAITQKKEVATKLKTSGGKKGWFKTKKKEED